MTYLDLSATSVEGEGSDDVSAVGVCLEAAGDVAGVTESQVILVNSSK